MCSELSLFLVGCSHLWYTGNSMLQDWCKVSGFFISFFYSIYKICKFIPHICCKGWRGMHINTDGSKNIFLCQDQMYFDYWLVLCLLFILYFSILYILHCSCEFFICFLFNHKNIQNTWLCYWIFDSVMIQGDSCFWSVGSWFCTGLLLTLDWPVISIVWFYLLPWHFFLLVLINNFTVTDLFGPWVNLFKDLLTRTFLIFLIYLISFFYSLTVNIGLKLINF